MKPTITRTFQILTVALAAVFVLSACGGSPTPLVVYITPTPEATTIAQQPTALPPSESPVPSEQPDTVTPPPTIPPDATYGSIAGQAPAIVPTNTTVEAATAQPTHAPSATAAPPPTTAPGVTYGAIVGPDYTPEPTETRVLPTLEPTVLPTAGPSPTPMPGLRRDLMGIQIHPHIDSREFSDMLARVHDLNLGWVKYQLNWSLLEDSSGHYTELFYMLRQYIQETHKQGFKVMVSIAKSPAWARSPGPDGTYHESGPPDDPQTLANSISGMLNLIGQDVDGSPYVDAIEIWNEPNLQREWYGHPITGQEYMRYFRPAYDAVRAFSPRVVVITAAPAPTGDTDWSTNDRTWLQQLYNAGLAQYGQNVAVGIHPYGWANPPDAHCCASPSRGWDDQPQFFFLDTIDDYHAIMLNNGHSAAQLWTTEFGWATFDGLRTANGNGPQPANPADTPYFSFIDQWQQANYTLEAFQIGQQRPYMGPMILWNLNFGTLLGAVDNSDPKAGYGLLDNRFQPRPVYQYLKQAPKN